MLNKQAIATHNEHTNDPVNYDDVRALTSNTNTASVSPCDYREIY